MKLTLALLSFVVVTISPLRSPTTSDLKSTCSHRDFLSNKVKIEVGEVTQDSAGQPNAAASTDEQAVNQAVLDYVEGIYNVDAARIERSVHPELAKTGFMRQRTGETYRQGRMTYEELIDVAKTYNKDGRVPQDPLKKIEIFEILDQTASIKLTAQWGIDYMHLAKFDGKWKIVNVMWQTHPPKK